MREATFDDLADLTGKLYEAAYDESQWAAAMEHLKSMLRGSSIVLGYYNERTGQQSVVHGDCGDEYGALFYEPALENPFIPAMIQASEGQVFTDTALMSKDVFKQTTFYNEWFLPQEEHSTLYSKVLLSGEVGGHLVVQRGGRTPEFDTADIELIRRITPVFNRIALLRERIGALRLSEEATAYDRLNIGSAVVDASGRLLRSNEVADRMLTAPPSGLRLNGIIVAAAEPVRDALLHQLIERACGNIGGIAGTGGDMSVNSSETGLPALAISVVPILNGGLYGLPATRAAVLFIQDFATRLSPGFEDRLRALFGLTKKEAALASDLALGMSLQESADKRFISKPTARTHLAQIFRKTNTSQQSQLVSLMLGVAPVQHRL